MTAEELYIRYREATPEEVVQHILEQRTIAVFPEEDTYTEFRRRVKEHFPADEVFVMGSANLGFSLSPTKRGLQFRQESDIDTVLISETLFAYFWDEIRGYHRKNYYLLDNGTQSILRRHGQDIYTGFVSPKFIPSKIYPLRRDFEISLNRLSDELVGYREVRAFVFRNRTEVYDYYKRGLIQFIQNTQ